MITDSISSISENIKNTFNESPVGQFINNDQASIFESYNDENNDGKVSFSAGAEAFASGAKDNIKGTIDKTIEFAKKHPIAAVATGAAVVGLGVLTGVGIPAMIAAGGALGALGTGLGVGLGGTAVCLGAKKALPAAKETFDELKNCLNSNNDKDTLEALYNMGYSTEDVIEGGVEAYLGGKAALNCLKARAISSAIGTLDGFEKESIVSDKGFELLKPAISKDPLSTEKYISNIKQYGNNTWIEDQQICLLESGVITPAHSTVKLDGLGYLEQYHAVNIMNNTENAAGVFSGLASGFIGLDIAGKELLDK